MKTNKPDAELVWKQLEDDLVPRLGLSLTERVVYAHLLRHSRLEGKCQLRFGIVWLARSARLSDATVRHVVRSLSAKGALRLIERARAGHVAEIRLPNEIHAAVSGGTVATGPARRARAASLEEMDFLQSRHRRDMIHERDGGHCFYCMSQICPRVRCLDHVVPLVRGGSNTYRNLVSSCNECNTQKGETAAEDFLRSLYRLRRLTPVELEGRLRALEALAAGELRPILAPPAAVKDRIL